MPFHSARHRRPVRLQQKRVFIACLVDCAQRGQCLIVPKISAISKRSFFFAASSASESSQRMDLFFAAETPPDTLHATPAFSACRCRLASAWTRRATSGSAANLAAFSAAVSGKYLLLSAWNSAQVRGGGLDLPAWLEGDPGGTPCMAADFAAISAKCRWYTTTAQGRGGTVDVLGWLDDAPAVLDGAPGGTTPCSLAGLAAFSA